MQNIRKYIPPAIIDLIKSIFTIAPILIGKYRTYNEAQANSAGYSENELIADAGLKTKMYKDFLRNSSTITINEIDTEILASFSMLKSLNKEIKVLDIGGSFGKYFFFLQKFLGDKIDLTWDVLELDTLCKKATLENYTANLHFFSEFESTRSKHYDIVLAIGSLEYFEDPIEIINKILNLNTKVLIINRIPLIDSPTHFSIQKFSLEDNGPFSNTSSKKRFKKVPICLINRDEILKILRNNYNTLLVKESNQYTLLHKLKRISTYCLIGIDNKLEKSDNLN